MEINKLPLLVIMVVSPVLYFNLIQDDYDEQELGQQAAAPVEYERIASSVNLNPRTHNKLSVTKIKAPVQLVSSNNTPAFYNPALAQIKLLENAPLDETYNSLQSMLSNADPVVRVAALESLGNLKYRGIPATLVGALTDSHPQVRVKALEALALQNDTSVVTGIEPYLYDQNQAVRIAAIDTLSELESEDAVITLAGLLSDSETIIRHQTVNALGEIGGDLAVMYLLQARYDPDDIIRANAETILFELGYKTAY